MGSPATPTAGAVQGSSRRRASWRRSKGSPATIDVTDGRATLPIALPRQAVSLVVVEW